MSAEHQSNRPGLRQDVGLASSLPPATVRRKLADHTLLQTIGRGSYGEVWLAQSPMGTFRAVKIIYRAKFDHDRPFTRELEGIRKFEPVSRSHEGFVHVLHVGRTEDGTCFYYVMELADDQVTGQQIIPTAYRPRTLGEDRALRGRLPIEECVRISVVLADALDHLHKHGLTHRDIKPSNIIIVSGKPKLADIGLVAEIGGGRSYVGTEGFIPPEGPGTPQADIYSLGKVLYEVSSGKDRCDFPALPADFSSFPDISAFQEFNQVVLRACHSDVGKRYSSAQNMLADLMVLKSGKSVKRLRVLERRWELIKRAALVAWIPLAAVSVVGYHVYSRAKLASDLRERQIGAVLSDGVHALTQGNMTRALYDFTEVLQLNHAAGRNGTQSRLRCGAALAECPKLLHLGSNGKEVHWVEFSPDGSRLLISRYFDRFQIWDLEKDQSVGPGFPAHSGLEMASWSPNGRYIVSAGSGKAVRVWDAETSRVLHYWEHPAAVYSAKFSPDGMCVLTACEDKNARVWNCGTGKLALTLGQHQAAVLYACYSPDGKRILTTTRDGFARVWDATSGDLVGVPLHHPQWVYHGSFSPDGHRVVTACFDRKARVWDVATGHCIPPHLNHADGIRSAEFSPDGRLIVTASLDGTVGVWDASTQLPYFRNGLLRHSSRVLHATFSPDAHSVATSCTDGTTRVWDLAADLAMPNPTSDAFNRDGTLAFTLTSHGVRLRTYNRPVPSRSIGGPRIKEAHFSSNGLRLFTVSIDLDSSALVEVWDAVTGLKSTPGIRCATPPEGAILDADGRTLLTYRGSQAQVWSVNDASFATRSLSLLDRIAGAQFNPQGNLVVLWGGTQVYVFDVVTGKLKFDPLPHPTGVTHTEFSPDGTRLVTCFANDQLSPCWAQIWDVRTGFRIGQPLWHPDGVRWAAFSPDGKRLVTACEDFAARVWDLQKGSILTPPLIHDDQVQMASFSSDGRAIVTASSDATARVWDVATGFPLTPPLRHPIPLREASLFGDSRHVLTAADSQHAWLWELPIDPRPVQDMRALASLLTGETLVRGPSDTRHAPAPGNNLKSTWQDLKKRYPGNFITTQAELLAWHRGQADQCEKQELWEAASFHLHRLLKLLPSDAELQKRLKSVETELRKSTVSSGDRNPG